MTRRQTQKREASTESLLESRLFKLSSKLALSAVVVLLFLTFSQCTIKKPESPTWITQLTIPVVNRTYTMSEIVEKMDQEGISMDADSNVVFSITREIDTVALDGDELTTSDVSYSVAEQLGPIDIDPPVIDPVTVNIAEITDLATYIPGTVPAMSFNIDNSMPTISSFSAATIANGEAHIVISNSLGFDLSSVTVELYDIVNARTVGTPQSFPGGVPDGTTDSVLFPLDGETISNSLEARVSASTPGGYLGLATGKNLTTTMRFADSLTVSSATAEVPALARSFSQQVTLGEPGDDPVYRARLADGTLQLHISNQTNLDAQLDITFPDLVFSSVPLTVQQSVEPNSSDTITIDLAGYDLAPSDSTAPQDVAVEVVASVNGTAPQQVVVAQTDQFSISASLTDLSFSSVTGLFSAVESTIDPTQEEIDVPEGFDSLQLVTAILTLDIENAVNLPGSLDITLQGDNGKTLNIVGDVAAGTLEQAITTSIVDTTVADFLSPVPSLIDISGSASFGDGISEGTITTDDYVFVRVSILAPLEVIINETTIETDVESEDIDEEDIDIITDHVVEARFLYNITNRLPLGASFNIYLSGDSASVYDDPELLIDNIFIVAAPTTGGIASDTVSTGYQEIVLDSLDIRVLENDTLYIGSELVLEDSGGEAVRLTNSDYVKVTGRIEIEYRFDGEF